jgi:hypothetical protein
MGFGFVKSPDSLHSQVEVRACKRDGCLKCEAEVRAKERQHRKDMQMISTRKSSIKRESKLEN